MLCCRIDTQYTVCWWLYDVSEWGNGRWPHVFYGCYSNHSTVQFCIYHRFLSPLCIQFVMKFKMLCDFRPVTRCHAKLLVNCCIPVTQVATRRHLRSAAHHQLTVPRHHLNTYGRRAFAVAGPMTFNTLPNDLRDPSDSTATFGQLLKTHRLSAYQHV